MSSMLQEGALGKLIMVTECIATILASNPRHHFEYTLSSIGESGSYKVLKYRSQCTKLNEVSPTGRSFASLEFLVFFRDQDPWECSGEMFAARLRRSITDKRGASDQGRFEPCHLRPDRGGQWD